MKKNLITSPLSMFKHKIFQPTMIKGVLRAAYATKTMKAKAIDHTGNVTLFLIGLGQILKPISCAN